MEKKLILKCSNIIKRIGKKEVLKNINLCLYEGDILALIGENGAGKTTLIKTILGLYNYEGKVIINGYDLNKDFVGAVKKVGAIVENPDLYNNLTGYQNLKLVANNYSNINEKNIMEVVKTVGLEKNIFDKVKNYSLGMKQRLAIGIALLNKPNLLILDEPTNGLDPIGIKDLKELLLTLSLKNVGIIISSHNLLELETFCNKVCIMKDGKIIENNTMKFIKNKIMNLYKIEVSDTRNIAIDNVSVCDERYLNFRGNKNELSRLIRSLILNGINIYSIESEEVSLTDLFIEKLEVVK